MVRATAETALPCGAVCEVEDGGGGALKAPSRSAEREDGRQGHAELELRASRARVGELERNEEVLKQQLNHCLEDAAAQQELVWAARIAASEEAERLEASVSQLRAQARPFSPTQRAAAAGAHGPAHAIRDRVPQLAETTKRRELLKVVAVSELRRVELLLE